MKVVVLVDGTYNNPRHRAGRAKAGDIIEVAGGGYGTSLVRDGFVALANVLSVEPADAATADPTDTATAEPADTPAAEPADAATAEPADAPAAEPADAPVEASPPAGKRKAAGTKAK